MALSLALPLSGLEPEQFCLRTRMLYEQGLRCLTGYGPISPSISSESSGISSLTPSIESTTPEETPVSSRPDTPAEEILRKQENVSWNRSDSNLPTIRINRDSFFPQTDPPLRIYYRDRDILNLGANIREPSWQMRIPTMPRYDFKSFMENRSVYYRLGEHGLTEEYPTVSKPSPICFIVITLRFKDNLKQTSYRKFHRSLAKIVQDSILIKYLITLLSRYGLLQLSKKCPRTYPKYFGVRDYSVQFRTELPGVPTTKRKSLAPLSATLRATSKEAPSVSSKTFPLKSLSAARYVPLRPPCAAIPSVSPRSFGEHLTWSGSSSFETDRTRVQRLSGRGSNISGISASNDCKGIG